MLTGLDVPAGSRVLDIGSSTLHYRTVEQPHIEREVLAPLRARGAEIVHLDAKRDPGVDVVCDLDEAGPELAAGLGEHRLVLLTSVLHYLRRPERAVDLAVRTLAPGGHVIAHAPERTRRSHDPVDRMLRLAPGELAALFEARGLERVRADSVRIDDPRYYRGLRSRASHVPVRGRLWLPLPGGSEQLRRAVPPWRWRQSCVVMRYGRRA